MIAEALHYTRLAWGLRRAVRHPLHTDPEQLLASQLARRETTFLSLAEQVVFANPANPYRQMFAEAGCTLGDLRTLVAARGLEGALDFLRTMGIRLSHTEFKGREPLRRGRLTLQVAPGDFVNPLPAGAWHTYTSGSTGRPTRVPETLAHYAHVECYEALTFQELGASDRHWLTLNPLLPAVFGFSRPIFWNKRGLRPQRWYAVGGSLADAGPYRFASRFLAAELRLLGAPIAPIRYLPPNDFVPAARELAEARLTGRLGLVTGSVSSCVRLAAAALEKGLDISGTRFLTSSEALTRAKADVVHRAGGEAVATYWMSEMGLLGAGCRHYEGHNSVHLFEDAFAVTVNRRPADGTDHEVNSLLFTTLLPYAPFFLINLEVGDHAELEGAGCNCVYARLGMTRILSGIYSFDKLTGHGATLVGNDLLRILEQVLPARFGGTPMDYQLVEEEGQGDTRIALFVHPRLAPVDTIALKECFLSEIRKLFGGALTTRTWRHADAVTVKVEAPRMGRTGKIMPLHYLGPQPR